MAQDRLDIIIMGASGYSGRQTTKVLMKLSKQDRISWGVAGRNPEKLQSLLRELSEQDQNIPNKLPIFIADVFDEESLERMTAKAKVVINCCGPYRFYGEPVVKACIKTKTHYLDVSGEPQFMEEMQLHYHDQSSEQGVYVVSACGMSGILADLGVFHFDKLFNGTVNDIEFYVKFEYLGSIGSPIHDGTWASLVHGLAHKSELYDVRKKLFPKPLPKLYPEIVKRSVLHRNKLFNSWCLPFAGADRSVVRRSQYLMYLEKNERPIQAQAYFLTESFFISMLCIIIYIIITVMSVLGGKYCRNLLIKYPKFFTGGFVSHEGPSEKEADNVILAMTLLGNGWKNKITNNNFTTKPDKTMKIKLSARNPGYGFTCYSIILAAMTIINERSLMPGTGGVYPPGFAFTDTSLLDKLQDQAGLKIEIL